FANRPWPAVNSALITLGNLRQLTAINALHGAHHSRPWAPGQTQSHPARRPWNSTTGRQAADTKTRDNILARLSQIDLGQQSTQP
ncbi:hypothetical protein ACNQUF_12620, partial [Corynebacterium diphtheriae]